MIKRMKGIAAGCGLVVALAACGAETPETAPRAPVIIQLNVVIPDADGAALDRALDDMGAVQDKVAQAVEEQGGTVTHRYSMLPHLAADVSGEALVHLLSMPEVAGIVPDRENAPRNGAQQ